MVHMAPAIFQSAHILATLNEFVLTGNLILSLMTPFQQHFSAFFFFVCFHCIKVNDSVLIPSELRSEMLKRRHCVRL